MNSGPTTEQQREWAKRQAERIANGASRHQHDTLDQIREHLEAIRDEAQGRADDHSKHPLWDGCQSCQKFYPCTDRIGAYVILDAAVAALAKFDALLAEGRVFYCPECAEHFKPGDSPHAECEDVETYLWLLVGAGCGNAKKDTP